MKRMNKMNRKIAYVFVALTLLVSVPLSAQVLIMDDEYEGNIRTGYQEFELVTPIQGLDNDQYLPLGDGCLLLMGMGTAYLLKQARKKKKE